MAGNNMESLLLQGDDSSSGESDAEDNVNNNNGGAQQSTSASTVPGPIGAPPPLQQPTVTAMAPPPPTASQSEMAARLKSMYSPATKSNIQTKQQQPASQMPPPTHQQQPQQPQPGTMPSSVPPGAPYNRNISAGSSHLGPPPTQQQQQQQQVPPPGVGHGPPPQMHHYRPGTNVPGVPISHQPQQQQQQAQAMRTAPVAQKPTTHHPGAQPMYTSRGGITQASSGGVPTQSTVSNVPDPFEPTPLSTIQERSKAARQQQQQHQQQQQQQQQQHQQQQQQQPNPAIMVQQPGGASIGSMSTSSHRSASGYHPGMPTAPSVPSAPTAPTRSATIPPGAPSGSVRTSSSGAAAAVAAMSRADREREMKKYKERFLFFTRVLIKYLEAKDPALHQKVKAIIKDCAEKNRRQEPGYESVTTSMRTQLKAHVPDIYWKKAEAHLEQLMKARAKSNAAGASLTPNSTMPQPPAGGSTIPMAGPTTQPIGSSAPGTLDDRRRSQEMARAQAQQRPGSVDTNQPLVAVGTQQQQQDRRLSIGRSNHSTATSQIQQPTLAVSQAPGIAVPQATGAAPVAPAAASYADNKKNGKGRNSKVAATAAAQQRKGSTTPVPMSTPTAAKPPSSMAIDTPPQPTPPVPVESVAPVVAPVVPVVKPPPPPVREYSKFMELVDHAANFDWTVAGLIMEKEQPEILSAEQKALLDDTRKGATLNAATRIQDPFPLPGWGLRNVLSARSAWALLRGPEESFVKSRNGSSTIGLIPSPTSRPDFFYEHSWVNEQKAEDDKVLAVISEGLQIYLRGVMEKAVHCARQRYNVDGIRLWHQQTAVAMKAKVAASKDAKAGSTNNDDDKGANDPETTPPPLTLRVGCDVTRQIAQASGNAAMTVKRMEEALANLPARNNQTLFNSKTEISCLLQSSSMSNLALLPKLAQAIEEADVSGKRNFEVYGGKHSNEPPLGRLPKQPKLEVIDFQMGMSIARHSNRRSRAGTNSSSFFF